jgi:hypothetical protein
MIVDNRTKAPNNNEGHTVRTSVLSPKRLRQSGWLGAPQAPRRSSIRGHGNRQVRPSRDAGSSPRRAK